MSFSKFFKNKHYLLLILIIALSAFLRLWKLGDLPQGFHNDEVMNGYVGRFILENGKDIYGNRWPILYFNNFGDYPNVIPMYLSGLSTIILGNTVFAVRFPIAALGILTTVLVYLVARWLWKPKWLALSAALFISIFPSHISLSRATAEGITAVLVYLLAVWIFSIGIDRKKILFLFSGFLLLLSTYLLYPSYRIVVPLTLLATPFLVTTKKLRILMIGLFLLSLLLTLSISQTVWGKGRFSQTSIFTFNDTLLGKSQLYSTELGPNRIFEARLFHSKLLLTGREFLRQYVSYFSPSYLFGPGGLPARYSVPEHGFLYWSVAIIIIAGAISFVYQPINSNGWHLLFKNNRQKFFLLITWILFILPIPAALTLDDVPNVHRTIGMSVFFAFFVSIALYLVSATNIKFKKIFKSFIFIMLTVELIYFWHYFTNLYSIHSGLYRKDEQTVLANWLKDNAIQYDIVFVPSGESAAIHYLFRTNDFSSELSEKFLIGMKIDAINNISFIDNSCVSEALPVEKVTANTAVVERFTCSSESSYTIKSILYRYKDSGAYNVLVPTLNSQGKPLLLDNKTSESDLTKLN